MQTQGGLFWKLEAWWLDLAASQPTEILVAGIAVVSLAAFFALRHGIRSALSDEQISFS